MIRLARLLDEVKDKEAQGYAYEGADASFELLARRAASARCRIFSRSNVLASTSSAAITPKGELVTVSEAVVKVTSMAMKMISAAEGNGPVNALDLALRKDLGKYQRFIEDLELVDYRVRVFQGGTDAVTRVLIEIRDASGDNWSTVGVSANIIDASFQALIDAITYKLLKAGA